MGKVRRLERGLIYHVYNRGNNREELFADPASYDYFMHLVKRHILPIADVYCYCLLRNHFHLLVRILLDSELERTAHPRIRSVRPSQQFGNCFNAFTKATNAARGRTGCLFERPFGRRLVLSRDYFRRLVLYIHLNPQSHGLVSSFADWPHSSYPGYARGGDHLLKRATVVGLFGGRSQFADLHSYEALGTGSTRRPNEKSMTGNGNVSLQPAT